MDQPTRRVKSKVNNFSDINIAQRTKEVDNPKPIAKNSDKSKERKKAPTNSVNSAKKGTGAGTENSNVVPIKDMRTAVVTACNVEIARSRFLSLIGVERRGGEPSQRYTIKDEKAADRIARDFAERL